MAAARTEPMPSTMVQKMTGEIIIVMRRTNASPSTDRDDPSPSGPKPPTSAPDTTATMTAM